MPPVNPYAKYIKQYQASNVNTATPEKLMIMLFDAAIQFLQKAKTAIAEHKFKERSDNIDGARKIIRELMRTIDLDNGNDVSKQLFKLYNRMAMNLIKANVQRNSDIVDSVIDDLNNIRWGFQKAIEIQSGITTLETALQEQEAFDALTPDPVIPQEVSQQEDINIENVSQTLNEEEKPSAGGIRINLGDNNAG